tara:strand:- start:132 stop:458 length:327 start_codon:yes stop_codon:yes gene_type:complete
MGRILKMTTITKLEKQVLDDIANCDMSTDGHGLHGPTYQENFSLPMSQVRALLSTLSQKGIVGVDSAEDMGEDYGWVRIKDEYAVEASESDPDLIKWTGYKLVNLEVK